MRTIDYMIEVMTAARDGKPVQFKRWDATKEPWDIVPEASWNWAKYDYRIAPETRKAREWWIIPGDLIEDGVRRADGKIYAVPGSGIHVREVIE